MRVRIALWVLLALPIVFAPMSASTTTGWPAFRGPTGNGLSSETNVPTRWSTTEGVKWAVDVPGRGWSSPIVWNGRVYVTSAISSRPFKQPTPGLYCNDYIAELKKQGLPDDDPAALPSGEVRLPWPFTQAELAGMIGGSRQTVNRMLADFVADGLLRFEDDELVIPDPARLAAAARR